MSDDILNAVESYLPDDPHEWAKSASEIQWRRLQLMLLREILVEVRDLNQTLERERDTEE